MIGAQGSSWRYNGTTGGGVITKLDCILAMLSCHKKNPSDLQGIWPHKIMNLPVHGLLHSSYTSLHRGAGTILFGGRGGGGGGKNVDMPSDCHNLGEGAQAYPSP